MLVAQPQLTPEDGEKIDKALESCQYIVSEIEGVFTNRLLRNGFKMHAAGGLIKGNATGDGVIAAISTDMEKMLQHFGDNSILDNVLNSIAPGGSHGPHKKIQIIAPYNRGNHWLTCEINIEGSGGEYTCTTYLHNPFGGEQLNDSVERGNLEQHIRTTLLKGGEPITFEFPTSPYRLKRQQDYTSCGPIVAEEIIQLATTGKIAQIKYSSGALDIRRGQLKSLIAQEAEKPEGFNTLVTGIKDKIILSEAETAKIKDQIKERASNLQNEELCNSIAVEIFEPNETLRSEALNLDSNKSAQAEKLKELNASLDKTKHLLEQLQLEGQHTTQNAEMNQALERAIECIEQLHIEQSSKQVLLDTDEWNTWVVPFLEQLQKFLQEYRGTHSSFPGIFKSQEVKCIKELEETYIEKLTTETVKGKLKIYSASLENTTPKSKSNSAKTKEPSKTDTVPTQMANGASSNSAKNQQANNYAIIGSGLAGTGISLIVISATVFFIGGGKKNELSMQLAGAFLILGAVSIAVAIITRCLTPDPNTAMQETQVTNNTDVARA